MVQRRAISKGTRFRIFARDGFTCRYCGVQADGARLVVDHLIPVVAGGTNDDENLITACEPCNQGKGGKTLDRHAPTEADRLRLAQERNEQLRAAEDAKEAIAARAAFAQIVVNLWCEVRGTDEVDSSTINVMRHYAEEFGVVLVAEWIDKAHARFPGASDGTIGRYVSGIARRVREERGTDAA